MSANKYLSSATDGFKRLYTAIAASTGVADAGKIICTNASGQLDATLLPSGISAPTETVQAVEALSAGDLVNIHNVTGSARVRKANATSGIPANGFVLSAVASGANALVYLEGNNTALTGLTIGSTYFLGATGGVTTTPNTTTSGAIIQEVGSAIRTTAIAWNRQDHIVIN